MAFDYQTVLDRQANNVFLNALQLGQQRMQFEKQLQARKAEDEAERAFRREILTSSQQQQLDLVREQEKLREQQEIAREKRQEQAGIRANEMRDRDQIETALTNLGAQFSKDATTDELRKFLASITSGVTATREKNLETSFQTLTTNRRKLESEIDKLAGQLSASPVSLQKQRTIAYTLSADKKLDLTDEQRRRLQMFGSGQEAQRRPDGTTITPLSPTDLLNLVSQSGRNAIAGRIAEELTNVGDPKRDAEILGIASQIEARRKELDQLQRDRDSLLKADPTLLRLEAETAAPIAAPERAATDQGALRRFAQGLASRTPTAAALPVQEVSAPPLPLPPTNVMPGIPGIADQAAGLVGQGANALAPLAPVAALPFTGPSDIGAAIGRTAGAMIGPSVGNPLGNFYQRNVAPVIEAGRSFVSPRLQELTMRLFGVDNPNATQEELSQVERLAQLKSGYSDAEIARKVELMKAGDIPTLREYYDLLKQVRNMNAARGLNQPPVLQTPTGSTTNVFAPVSP